MYVGSNVFFKASVEFVSVSFIIISCRCLSWHTTCLCLAGGLSSRAIVIVSGVDPGFDGGGSDNRPPKAVVLTGGRRACSPGKFFYFRASEMRFPAFWGEI